MSTKIDELQAAHSGFHHLSEEEWQHMAFYCMVMAFWEVISCFYYFGDTNMLIQIH